MTRSGRLEGESFGGRSLRCIVDNVESGGHTTPRRVLLKLSGEAFGGGQVGIDVEVVQRVAKEIVEAVRTGVQVAIVVGGGNFFRGAELSQAGIERSRGDYMEIGRAHV